MRRQAAKRPQPALGRVDPAPRPPGRGGQSSSPSGWIVAGVLAIALAPLVAFKAAKRSIAALADA